MSREITVKIGHPIPLQGIVNVPEEKNTKLGVILLNSGIMHRAGACRMTVKIARQTALDLGVFCVRFDFSGIGDSEPRAAGNLDFEDTPVKEVQEVMDYCQKQYGIEQFILYGLCSGAHISCKTGEVDQRVAAIIQIDGYCYPTTKSYFLYYLKRLSSLNFWLNRLKRFLGIKKPSSSANRQVLTSDTSNANFEIPQYVQMPPKSVAEKRLSIIAEKGISLHSVFTGKEPYYLYKQQYRDCFSTINFGDKLSIEYFPEASHIFTEPGSQKMLVESIVDYLKRIA